MKKLITHWTSRRWLSAYLDGELTGETLLSVGQHVGVCRTCQRDLERIRTGRDLLTGEEVLREQPPVSVTSGYSYFQHVWGVRLGVIAALAVMIVVASVSLDSRNWLAGWLRPSSAHAMEINFYAAQFSRTDHCVAHCTALVETTLDELRSSPPFAVQYPTWLPEGMVLRRVIRYRTPRYEGVGFVFVGYGKRLCLFQQPRRLGVATSGKRTSETRICGRKCTWIDGDQVQLYRWMNLDFCFVVATNLAKHEVESVVEALGALSK